MNFELTKIDPNNCSIEELKEEVEKLNNLHLQQLGNEQSIKILMNSLYGGLANQWFIAYNVTLAEAITLQGQDINKFAAKQIDIYFREYWHKDVELHKKLGLTYVNKLSSSLSLPIYMDTDSIYFYYKSVLDSCDYKGNPVDFMKTIRNYRLNPFLNKKLEEYAAYWNTKNIQNYELEKISYSALMIAKKKYILDFAWKDGKGDGIYYEPQSKIKPVGIELVQGSTPKYARKVLKELIKLIMRDGKTIDYAKIVQILKDYKKDFVLQNPEDISKTVAIGDYEKYIAEDRKELNLRLKCPIGVKAAGIYNHILLNSKWKSKYSLLKTGHKVKHYYSKDTNEVFGFHPGRYPYEFAPPINYDEQFAKIIIDPFNRYIETLGFPQIPHSLIYANSLF